MKKTMAAAMFVLVGGGAIAAAALSNIDFWGAREENDFTLSLLANCTGTSGLGGLSWLAVSPAGESAMIASQTVEPMDRFLSLYGEDDNCDDARFGACNAADPSQAEGIAFGINAPTIRVEHRARRQWPVLATERPDLRRLPARELRRPRALPEQRLPEQPRWHPEQSMSER